MNTHSVRHTHTYPLIKPSDNSRDLYSRQKKHRALDAPGRAEIRKRKKNENSPKATAKKEREREAEEDEERERGRRRRRRKSKRRVSQ